MTRKKELADKTASWRQGLAREVRRARKVSVLAAGNALRGDDAAGLAAADALAARLSGSTASGRRLQILKTFEVPENFTGAVRAFGPDLVILVDAAVGGRPPGEVYRVDPAAIGSEDISTHRIPLSALVRFLEMEVGCAVLVLGIQPLSLDLGSPLSKPVARGVRSLVRALVRALEKAAPSGAAAS